MKIFVAALGAVLLCACKTYHHEEKGESKFFEQVEASDPANKPEAKTADKVSIKISVLMAEMPVDLATEIFGKADWNGTTFGVNETPDFDALVAAHAAVDIVSRPKIVVHDGQKAEVANTNKVEYLSDYESGALGAPKPIRAFVEEGTWFEATPKLDMTLELVDLEYSFKRTTLERPIVEKSIVLPGTNQHVPVQLPEASTRSTSGHRRLSSGETVAVAVNSMRPPQPGNRVTVALITVDFWNP